MMKLLKHYSMFAKANSYIIGQELGGDAILVDPAIMDIHMLNLIEDNNFYIKHILITHNHEHHVEALKTILKIYEADVYSYYRLLETDNAKTLAGGEKITLSGFNINVFHIPGHSTDSLVYKIGDFLFVGDVLSAGLCGRCDTKVEEEILLDGIESKLLTLEDNCIVLPGHGPPSLLETEKKMINLYDPLK